MDEILNSVDNGFVYSSAHAIRAVVSKQNSRQHVFQIEGDKKKATTVYEQEYVDRELNKYYKNVVVPRRPGGFSEVDSIGTDNGAFIGDIYRRHNFALNTHVKKELPIDEYKDQILSRIDLNQVTVIEGPTGCGKTTQIPQMIMDSHRVNQQYCKIVVTQPRKIATINVAKRVCEERGWTLGTVCGYQVGLEKVTSKDQLITYVTLGVLLQKIIYAKNLKEFTHIIVDEVHERNQELDFLLLIIRKYLFTNSPHTRIVLMSATIDSDMFAHYFKKKVLGNIIPAPIIKVEKELDYHKSIFYLEEIWKFAKPMPTFEIDEPGISKDMYELFIFILEIFDRIDAENICEGSPKNGSVLAFLPGIAEIEEAHKLLQMKNASSQRGIKWDIVPLHSSLPNNEQAKAFKSSRPGYRKVILSTNIAESSITVVDSTYVVDFCLTKMMTVARVTNYMSLKLEWASRVNCDQRAGRVGRTCNGRVYRLVPKNFFFRQMAHTSDPEILRAPLNSVVLQAKLMDLYESPSQVLALALQPPNLENIETTILQLKETGAMLRTCRGEQSKNDGDITYLGGVMANLPLDVYLSKLIVLGQLFSCLEETVIIAAGCSIQNIFATPFQKRLEAYRKLLTWADSSNSDLIALLNLYTVWQHLKRENAFASERAEHEWCFKNLVNLKGLKEWHLLVSEIKQRLNHMNLKETMGTGKVVLSDIEKPTVLKVVMAGAFYPNYFIKYPENSDYERDAVKTLGGRDPFSTVYFTGMDSTHPSQIYVRQIKEMLQSHTDAKMGDTYIGFDGSSKIYVEFRNSFQRDPVAVNVNGAMRLTNASGKIPNIVYEMIRQRQLRYQFNLKLLNYDDAWNFAEKHGIRRFQPLTNFGAVKRDHSESMLQYSAIPSLDTQYVHIHISNHVDAAHFWVQNDDPPTNKLLLEIDNILNRQVLKKLEKNSEVGGLYVARFNDDGLFYRCKVLSITGRLNQVLFVDYGNLQETKQDDLFDLPPNPVCHIAPLAYECALMGIRPTYRFNPAGVWSDRVNTEFCQLAGRISLYGEVYSVVNNLVELVVYRSEHKGVSINQYLIDKEYAEPCNPSFLSKQNHEQRLQVCYSSNPSQEAQRLNTGLVSFQDFADPKTGNRRYNVIPLKGPYSPLETQVYGLINGVSQTGVDIEGSSVNSVLLNHEPDCRYSRLIVAASVNQSSSGNKLMLRQTALMPNVAGLPMLMSCLFCPTMEPKLTKDRSRIAAILCGLGYNQRNHASLYPSHDILLKLDTEFNVEELEMINKLRYLMNCGLKLMDDPDQSKSSQDALISTQVKIREFLFLLMNMTRSVIDRDRVSSANCSWKREDDVTLLRPNMDNNEDNVWQLLWFVKVNRMNQQQKDIAANLEKINDYLYEITPFESISCLLCNFEADFLSDLRLHVISDLHEINLANFKEELRESNETDEDE